MGSTLIDNVGWTGGHQMAEAGNLTTLTSRTQDADSDGLTNEAEQNANTKPTVADTDGDGLSDGAEVNTHGSNPLVTDTDGDDMPDAWEATHGLSLVVANGFEDADGDRYPNIFEYVGSTNPNSRSSVPTATYTVNAAGGGTHTSIGAAISSATVTNGAYQIIAIAPGTYTGTINTNVTIASTKPKLLFIGLDGPKTTIVQGDLNDWGWQIYQSSVIASLTFRKTKSALYVNQAGTEVRFVDLVVRDNVGPNQYCSGVNVAAANKVHVVGSTLIDNVGWTGAHQIYIGAGTGTVINTVVLGTTSGTQVAKSGPATLVTNYSLVQGQTLTGTGNLAGNTNPKYDATLHLRSSSPLRGAGGTVAQSRIDLDGELRPSVAPDIGVDQFLDSDSDGLPDAWEIAQAGNLTAINGAADEDSDDLTNAEELDLGTNWLVADTDRDGVGDGLEVDLGMNPLVSDSDDLGGDLNGDGILDSIGAQLGHSPDDEDSDGDGVSNADELLMCIDPLRTDTDGDGVADGTDKFPHDPLASSLISNPLDTTPPVITLTRPWYAVEQ